MRLDEYLEGRGERPSEFAARAGVAVSMITRLLRGERGVSLETAVRIEDATQGAVSARNLLPETPAGPVAASASP